MNHAAGGGCCGGAAAGQAATKAGEDHSAHQAAQPAAKAEAAPMQHGAGAGCCANMAMDQSAPKAGSFAMTTGTAGCSAMGAGQDATPAAKAAPMAHEAGASCCAGMNHDAATPAGQAMEHGAGGCCGGNGAMAGMSGKSDTSMMADMEVFHFLLDNRADVRRTVTKLPNGIDTLTESDKPELAQKIKTHVSAMYSRLKDGRPIHQRDPLFVELFEHADQVEMNITYTDAGVRVVETSTDPAVAILLHKHADAVSGFIKNGMPEVMKNHLE
jgi:hypothetical protein